MIAFELREAGRDEVFAFMDRLKLIVRATSLGDVHTMMLYPVMSSHREVSPKQRERMGIRQSGAAFRRHRGGGGHLRRSGPGVGIEPTRAPRNRTLALSASERTRIRRRLLRPNGPLSEEAFENRIINADLFHVLGWLPEGFVDLLFVDPPYNLDKTFGGLRFRRGTIQEYAGWVESWLVPLLSTLKPYASVYLCGDWRSSAALQMAASRHLIVRNRITWEREKGRGARANWKNCSEDMWFCTVSNRYTFDASRVRLRRRVRAPYTDENSNPKDWQRDDAGEEWRLTYPSNLWTDLTVPFWSMAENTGHPAQKPEKLLAKIILASTAPGDFVFDPFAGSGTALVAAKKLGRRYAGVEVDEGYCCLAEKRLELAEKDCRIQGYDGGVFWERNSAPSRRQ